MYHFISSILIDLIINIRSKIIYFFKACFLQIFFLSRYTRKGLKRLAMGCMYPSIAIFEALSFLQELKTLVVGIVIDSACIIESSRDLDSVRRREGVVAGYWISGVI